MIRRNPNGFGLPPVIQQLRAELLKQGFYSAGATVKNMQKNNPAFQLNENELNAWGTNCWERKNRSTPYPSFN
jgi:hypothetical protein